MNPAELLGRSFACACGRTHAAGLEQVLYAERAAERLPALLAPRRRRGAVHLVADARTWEAAGAEAEAALRGAGWRVAPHVLRDPPRGDPVCDDATRAVLDASLGNRPADVLLAVGSGVVNDLVKWIAHERRTPYAVLATAASMNGYASANIAPAVRGVKRILGGTVAFAVAADPAVVGAAPPALTAAGLGDVLAKPVSTLDWHVNHLLFGDYHCALCAGLLRDLEPRYLEHPADLRARRPAAVRALFEGLVYSGLAMTLAGTSFPASGGEHLVSHVLDMKALAEGGAHDLHGRQVGLGVIVSAALYERLAALERPVFRYGEEPTDGVYWGALAPAVEEEHAGKRRAAARAVERLRAPGVWDRVRGRIAECAVPAARLKACLRDAGAAHTVADIGVTARDFAAALRRCHQVRARYTVIDLARAAGVLPGAADELVADWLLR